MKFGVLGPLEVSRDGRAVALPGGKPRAVLAFLLLHANEPVSAERLAVALWGDDAPAGATRTVQVYVSRLRRALGDHGLLATTPTGYRLRVRPGELDIDHAQRLFHEARHALAAGRSHDSGEMLREALGLWRGPPLADLAFQPFAQTDIARLEELRLAMVETLADADLAAGRHVELVPELQRLVSEHPLRERLHGQLMLALYRTGRQADALSAYRHARELFVEQLGIEPAPELRTLHQAILAHDPGIQARDATVWRSSALPVPWTPLVGRTTEVEEVSGRLRAADVRLLTLTGPGGVGKTRLALEVASRVEPAFAAGARFVGLSATAVPEDVPAAMAQAIGVVPARGESPASALGQFIGAQELLLVLDNLEHVAPGAGVIADLLASCPRLSVLATSRGPLRLRVEHVHDVKPLHSTDAVALLSALAARMEARAALDEEHAEAVCSRLDNLPLAIEVAAARLSLLAPEQLVQRLDDALDLVALRARDAPSRHRTLRATIDWSFELLGEQERAAFGAFSVFEGGATIDATERITKASLDVLDELVGASLLLRREGRLDMLATIRSYARERLARSPESNRIFWRHLNWCRAVAEEAEPYLRGPERGVWLSRLDAEAGNFRSALRWALHGEKGATAAQVGLALAAAVGPYWHLRGLGAEGLKWIGAALSRAATDTPASLRAKALLVRASLSPWSEHFASGTDAASEAYQLYARLEDSAGATRALIALATMELILGDLEASARHAADAVAAARKTGDDSLVAEAVGALIATMPLARAAPLSQDAAATLRDTGGHANVVTMLNGLGYAAVLQGRYTDADHTLAQALEVARELDRPELVAQVRGNQGLARLLTGDDAGAEEAFREELSIIRDCRLLLPLWAAQGVVGLAGVAVLRGDLEHAAWLSGAALAQRAPEGIYRRLAKLFVPARARLGAETWDRNLKAGRGITLADAIDKALQHAYAPR